MYTQLTHASTAGWLGHNSQQGTLTVLHCSHCMMVRREDRHCQEIRPRVINVQKQTGNVK